MGGRKSAFRVFRVTGSGFSPFQIHGNSDSATARGYEIHFLHLGSTSIRDGETNEGKVDGEQTEFGLPGSPGTHEQWLPQTNGQRRRYTLAVVRGGGLYPSSEGF